MLNFQTELTIYNKIWQILNKSQRIQVWYLFILLFIGMLLEMLGIGIIIPILGIVLNPNFVNKYEVVSDLFKLLGNPGPNLIIYYGMFFLILIYLIKTIFLIFLSWKQSAFIVNLSSFLSRKMYTGYMNQEYSFHLNKNSAQLGSYIMGEVGLFTNVLLSIVNLILEITTILGVTLVLFLVEPKGSIIVVMFLFTASIIFHRITRKRLLDWGKTRQLHQIELTKNLYQGLNGIKDILILNRLKYFIENFNHNLLKSAKTQIKVNTLNLVPRLYLEFLAVLGLAGLILIMVSQGKSFENLLPTLGVFVAAAFRMIPSANRIIASNQQIRYAKPAVNLLYEEHLFLNNKLSNYRECTQNFVFESKIEIKNIKFIYDNQNKHSINDISLNIEKGSSIGLIGVSGSGKSTLVDIFLGLLKPQQGEILVDGVSIYENLGSWKSKIGYVPQVIYLTDDTLLRNIAFGISDEEINFDAVKKAIDAAQLTDFIESLENKLETGVGERGVRISGGQRQRIGIARALYHDPEILVLDEATSALDIETEQEVMKAIDSLKGEKTMLIVAHRLSTLEKCDYILELRNGSINN